jgi:hypothetical protein
MAADSARHERRYRVRRRHSATWRNIAQSNILVVLMRDVPICDSGTV